MKHVVTLLGVVALLITVGSACTQVSAGDPRPSGSSATGTGSGEPSTSHPREIRLDGKDPCALVPDSNLHTFDIDKAGERRRNDTYDSPACYYSGNADAYFVTLVVTEGIDVWTDGSRNANVEKVDPVVGYPAITFTGDFDANRCDIAVDVADGQYLSTTVMPDDTDTRQSEICQAAHEFAEAAMSTLVGE